MKKRTLFRLGIVGFFACLIFSIIIYSCRKSSDSGYVAQTQVLTAPGRLSDGTVLPTGTRISTIQGDPHSLEIELPSGYSYVGYQLSTVNGASVATPIATSTVKITCTCSAPQGASCSPFSAGGQVGCSAGNCTTCTMTKSSYSPGLQYGTAPIIEGSVVASGQETHFISTLAELQSTRSAFSAMFELPAVQKEADRFQGFIDPKDRPAIQSGKIPAGYVVVPAAIYGRLVYVTVKKEYAPVTDLAQPSSAPAKYSCTCNSGSTGCVLGSAGMGAVHYCSAGACTSCTLTVG